MSHGKKHEPHVMRDLTHKVQIDVCNSVKQTTDLCPSMNDHIEIVQAAYCSVLRELVLCMAVAKLSPTEAAGTLAEIATHCIAICYKEHNEHLADMPQELRAILDGIRSL